MWPVPINALKRAKINPVKVTSRSDTLAKFVKPNIARSSSV